MTEHQIIYAAALSRFGLVARGSAKRLRAARSELAKDDPGLVDLIVLGPDLTGQVWIVRQDTLRGHLRE